jgi:hypothetical protein
VHSQDVIGAVEVPGLRAFFSYTETTSDELCTHGPIK